MNKIYVYLSRFVVLLFLYSLMSIASANDLQQMIGSRQLANVKLQFANNVITITNESNEVINLNDAILKFYSSEKVSAVRSFGHDAMQAKLDVNDFRGLPHNPGILHTLKIDKMDHGIIEPGKSIRLQVMTTGNEKVYGLQLFLAEPIPVPVKITVQATSHLVTVSVCNTTSTPIPLQNVELKFSWPERTSVKEIVGVPDLKWIENCRCKTGFILTGGTSSAPALQPDPSCQKPLLVKFYKASENPLPVNFIFKAAMDTPPVGTAAIDIAVPVAPAMNLPNPLVTIKGPGTDSTKVVAWGQKWKLENLANGTYTISASRVDNGTAFYQAAPITVNVTTQTTYPANLDFKPVPTGSVAVTLSGAPDPTEVVNFTGTNYSFSKSLGASSVVVLPADTYTITSSVSGYKVDITPNPLIVPANTTLKITYTPIVAPQKSSFGGYFESWRTNGASDPAKTDLATLPSYVGYVYLAFALPDTKYVKGSMNLATTGLEFNYASAAVLKQAIALLHQAKPNTKILLSVGGATYNNWAAFNATAVADIVKDFGLDGVDIDYEAGSPGCAKGADGLIRCAIDARFQTIIQSMRTALPRPMIISVTGWSIAAYGQDQWSSSQPIGDYTGMLLPFFRSTAVGLIDHVNVMSYDAGVTYKATEALAAYNNYYKGPLNMGVEVPPEAWGDHVYTLAEVNALATAVKNTSAGRAAPVGMMMWSLHKEPNDIPSASNPDAQMIASAICVALGLTNCQDPLFPNMTFRKYQK